MSCCWWSNPQQHYTLPGFSHSQLHTCECVSCQKLLDVTMVTVKQTLVKIMCGMIV